LIGSEPTPAHNGGYARGSIIGLVTLRNERTMSSQADLE
jgi:hypothetical protein